MQFFFLSELVSFKFAVSNIKAKYNKMNLFLSRQIMARHRIHFCWDCRNYYCQEEYIFESYDYWEVCNFHQYIFIENQFLKIALENNYAFIKTKNPNKTILIEKIT